MLALFMSNNRILKLLFPFCNLNTKDNNGNTPFIIAAANGNINALELILDMYDNV
jgi:ankyrin repeat protein